MPIPCGMPRVPPDRDAAGSETYSWPENQGGKGKGTRMKIMSKLGFGVAALASAGALTLALTAGPALADPSCTGYSGANPCASTPGMSASVTVASTISITSSATVLNYGAATPGTMQFPASGGGVDTDGAILMTVTTNDGNGFNVTGYASDWASGSSTFPASTLSSAINQYSGSDPGSFNTPVPLVEAGSGGSASATVIGQSVPGTFEYDQRWDLMVPVNTPGATSPYTTTITDTAIAS